MPIGPSEGQKSGFKELSEYFQKAKTPETQAAEATTRNAKGFLNTAGAYLQNPSAIYTGVGESLPSMVGGAGIGKTLAAKGVEPLLAASIGEGTIGAASTAQAISDQQGGKAPTLGQGAAALASGVLTAAFGQLGGKVAQKLGVEDIDKLFVAGATKEGAPVAASKIVAAIKGAISESTFEELPQSMQDQVMQNLATGKPWDDGVAEAGASGFMTALPAGAIAGAYGQHKENKAAAAAALDVAAQAEPTVEEQRPGRKEKIKDIHKELEELSKVAPAATTEEPPPPPPPPGVITAETLAGFKINPRSKAHENLLGVDVTTPEGKQTFDSILEHYTGKIDEDAVNAYTQAIPQPEVPNAGRIDSGTTGEGVQVPGQPVGQPATGGVAQPIGPTVAGPGSPIGTTEAGTVSEPAPLEPIALVKIMNESGKEFKNPSQVKKFLTSEIPQVKELAVENPKIFKELLDQWKAPEVQAAPEVQTAPEVTPLNAKVGEPFKVGDTMFVKNQDGSFQRADMPVAEAPKAEEVVKEEPILKADTPATSEFNMEELPKQDHDTTIHTIPEGTKLFHGAHGALADEIIANQSILKSRNKIKSSGGATNEGGLLWFGDREIAQAFADSKADPMMVKAQEERYGKRKPGTVFETVVNKPLRLIHKDYKLSQEEADALNKALDLPEYKHLQAGYDVDLAAHRAHSMESSNLERYKTQDGEMSAPWPVILKTLNFNGIYHPTGIALNVDDVKASTEEPVPEEAPAEETKAEAPRKNIWKQLANNGAAQIARMEELGGKKKPEAEHVSEEDLTDEEAFAKAKDTVGAFVRQNFGGVENIAPEDIVSPQQALASLVDIMHHVIRQGARNFAQAMAHARRGLGAHGAAIPTSQYRTAYNSAMARVNAAANNGAGYDAKLRRTGTKKPRPPEETWGSRFMGAPVQTTGEIIQILRSGLFSFDQATNKKILNAARKAGVSEADFARISHEIQVTQAVNGASLSDLYLERGNAEYDPVTYKFSITEVPANMAAIRQSLIDLAKKYKVSKEKFRTYASAAFIARRSAGLLTANEQLVTAARALAAQGKLKEAKALVQKNYKLVHLTQDQIDAGLDFFNDFPELEDAFNMWNQLRENILNFATTHGLFTEEQKDELLSVIDYVPFHRVEQILNKAGPKEYSNGLLDAVKDPKKFKGSYQEVNDVFDNMERWLRYTVRKAINNSVAQSKLKYYQEFLPDDVKEVGLGEKHETNTISIWQDGKIHRYAFQGVDGASMVQGFSGLEPVVLGSANVVMRAFSRVASASRANVVLNPIFALTQIFMDGSSAMFTSQTLVPFAIPLQVVKEIVLTPFGLSSARKELKSKGIVGKHGYFDSFAKLDAATGEEAKRYGTFDKLLEALVSPLHAIGLASDNIIRQAVYAQVLLESGDKALATHLAAEVINFHRAGYWAPIRVVRQLAPFVNAGLQSLHIAGSTILADGLTPQTKAKAVGRFLNTWVQVAGLTLLYAAMKSTDDKYKKLDPSERDHSIILNENFKIPLRMDLYTYIAKTVPEHVFNLLVEKSEDPTKFRKALQDGFLKAIALPSSTPTVLTPFTEMYFNKESGTGAPLIAQNQQGLDSSLQYNTKRTAEWAKYMGEQTGISPAVLENFIQSYFSMSSMIVAAVTNEYFAEKRGVTLPAKTTKEKLLEYPSFSAFLVKDFGARNLTDFYELNDKVKSVVDTFKKYETIDVNKAHEYLLKDHNQQLIMMQKEIGNVASELSKLKSYENIVREDRYHRWNPEEKAAELRRLEEARQTMLGHQFDLNQKKDRYVQQLRNVGGF